MLRKIKKKTNEFQKHFFGQNINCRTILSISWNGINMKLS